MCDKLSKERDKGPTSSPACLALTGAFYHGTASAPAGRGSGTAWSRHDASAETSAIIVIAMA